MGTTSKLMRKYNLSVVKTGPESLRTLSELTSIYQRLGQAVLIPISVGQKGPRIKGWQKIEFMDTQAKEYQDLLLYSNIGVLLGSPSRDLVVLDCDSEEAVQEVQKRFPFLADTFATRGRPERISYWMQMVGPYPEIHKEVKDLEWRGGNGHQCVVDGIHPDTGKRYSIAQDKPIQRYSYEQFRERCR
jgi:hypothetical protein